MASQGAAVPPALVAEGPSAAEKQRRRLERKWTFWFDKAWRGGASWGTSLAKVYSLDAV